MISSGICWSAKLDWLNGVHNVTDTYKIALYALSATLSPSQTSAYDSTGEVSLPGYTAGGLALSGAQTSLDGSVGIMTFSNPTWNNVTMVAGGALIYNSSKSNKSLLVIDFGSNQYSTNGKFTIQFPTFDGSNAIIRMV